MAELARSKPPANREKRMGKQTNIKLRGTVENTIYYQWRDIHCIRTVPARVRQTKATKKAATNFGIAVKSSAVVRSMFSKLMPQQPAATLSSIRWMALSGDGCRATPYKIRHR